MLFMVVVDRSGRVIGAHPLGLPGRRTMPGADAVKAARKELREWRFAPAQFHGRPVNDWTYVRVPVVRGP